MSREVGGRSRHSDPCCLACSIFRHELDRLKCEGIVDMDIRYVSSMLHMHPEKLDVLLEQELAERRGSGQDVLLLFGDCCPHMLSFQQEHGVVGPQAFNCCEILLGAERYRQLRREGVFFLLPEWAERYKEVFKDQLGLEGDMVQSFMRELHTRIVYLDTGAVGVPSALLREIETFTGLPIEILPIGMDELIKTLQGCRERLDHKSHA